jgi:hypothetical protein
MIRVVYLTVVLLADCNDSPSSRAIRSDSTLTASALGSTKPPLKAPDPETR